MRLLLLVALTMLAIGGCACGEPIVPMRDAAIDGPEGLDAPLRDAADAPLSPDSPAVIWTLDEAVASFCEPLATAECEAIATCECAVRRACDPEALALRCREALEAGTTDGRTIDGRYLAHLRIHRQRALESCVPIERERGVPFDIPRAAFVLPIPNAARCMLGDGYACAGGDGLCIAGRCAPRANGRSVCSPDVVDHCQPGLRCAGTCIPLGGEGETCDGEAEGLECEAGLVCADDRCVRLRSLGEACDAESPCSGCLRCEAGTCATVASRTGIEDDECGFGARCSRGTCQLLGELGDDCSAVQCAPSLVCPNATLRCELPPAEGAPCLDTVEPGTSCGPDLVCTSGICRAWPTAGEACTGRCASGLSCVASVCVADAAIGAPCDPSRATAPACVAGAYCDSGRICRAQSPDGAFCNRPEECLGGFCDALELECLSLPSEAERCIEGVCGAGLTCSVADVCVSGEGLGCLEPCGVGLICARTFECGW